MPLPQRRPTASLMDTYQCDVTELSCSSESGSVSGASVGSRVTSEHVVQEYIRRKHRAEAFYPAERSGSAQTQRTVPCSRSGTAHSHYSNPPNDVFRSGYFCSDFSARSKSSSAVILPPKSLPRVQRPKTSEPGPGSYTPVYSVLSRPSPFA